MKGLTSSTHSHERAVPLLTIEHDGPAGTKAGMGGTQHLHDRISLLAELRQLHLEVSTVIPLKVKGVALLLTL